MGNRTLISQLWKRNIQSLPYRKGFERDPFFEKWDNKSKKSNEREGQTETDRETEWMERENWGFTFSRSNIWLEKKNKRHSIILNS